MQPETAIQLVGLFLRLFKTSFVGSLRVDSSGKGKYFVDICVIFNSIRDARIVIENPKDREFAPVIIPF